MIVTASDVGFFGNIFVRKIVFSCVGDVMPGHDHMFDHVTLVSQGSVHFRCQVTGIDKTIVAPAFIETPAKAYHDLIALEPNSVAWCIFAVRDEDGFVS